MLIKEVCRIIINSAKNQNFQKSTLMRYQRALNRLLHFAETNGYIYYTQKFRNDYITNCVSKRDNLGYYSKRDREHFMNLFDDYLEKGEILFKVHSRKIVTPDTQYYNDMLNQFVKHLETTKSIAHSTIMSYRYPVRCLFQYLELNKIHNINEIDIALAQEFINKQKNIWNTGGLRNSLCGLRAFSLFLDRKDLYDYFKSMKVPREKYIVPYLTIDEINCLWDHIKSDEILYRDKAIILLCLTFGVRASDIISLKLTDINWSLNTISFIQQKTGNPLSLPLLPAVGNALFDYITNERPKIKNNIVFLRSLAPYKPFNDHASIYSVISKACTIANISLKDRIGGTTLFRHNAASQLLKNSIPQSTIASILGHTNPDTTSIYITTDDKIMKKCILTVPDFFKEDYKYECTI